VGYWRVGSISEPYGRFARGFENATGKNAMYFNIDDAFFTNKALNGQYSVKVKVVYFDQGTGSWELKYDAQSSAQKSALKITKTNTGTWKTATVNLTDAYFGNRCPNSTDLMLVNSDAEDDIFHIVELTRTTGDRKGYWGYKQSITNIDRVEKDAVKDIIIYNKGLNEIAVKILNSNIDKIKVRVRSSSGILLYDKLFYINDLSNEIGIDTLKTFKSGVYIVEVSGANFSVTKKIIL
jgi:hypothetical protein